MDNGHVNIIKIDKVNTRVYYNLQEIGRPNFDMVLDDFVKKHILVKTRIQVRVLSRNRRSEYDQLAEFY
jgi:hypothetical protein